MDTRGIKLTRLVLLILYLVTWSSDAKCSCHHKRPTTTERTSPICQCQLKSDCKPINIVTPRDNGFRPKCDDQHVCCKSTPQEETPFNMEVHPIPPPAKPSENLCVPQSQCTKTANPAHSTDCMVPNVLCYKDSVIKPLPSPAPVRECGIKNPNALKIIDRNGIGNKESVNDNTTVTFGEIQWMAIIQRKVDLNDGTSLYDFACVGSILTQNVILTAASCVNAYGKENLKVRVGDFDMNEINPLYKPEERNIHRLCVHPKFQPKILHHDLALLYVDSPFNIGEKSHFSPICIDTINDHSKKYDLNNCLVAGWGRSSYHDEINSYYSNKLRKADVSLLSSFDCTTQLKVAFSNESYVLDPSFICTEPKPDVDVCRGDHGGPLACPSKENPKQYYQVGVVSWSHGGCRRKTPRVYASVGADSGWLHNTIQNLNSSGTCALLTT